MSASRSCCETHKATSSTLVPSCELALTCGGSSACKAGEETTSEVPWWRIGCLWWIVRAAAPAWSVQANAHGWCKECAGTCIREPARMGMTPDRAYDASASGDDRQPEMMLRTAVRKGDASEVLTVVVRILSRESCSVRSMYLDKRLLSSCPYDWTFFCPHYRYSCTIVHVPVLQSYPTINP